MNKNIRLVVLILVVCVLSACSSFPKPEKTVKLYLDSAKVLNFETMKTLVTSEEAQERLTKMANNEYESLNNFMNYLKECASKIDYTILDSEVTENVATVKVLCKYVDGGILLKEAFYEILKGIVVRSSGGKELTKEENNQLCIDVINNVLPNIEEKIIEQTIDVTLQKTETGWIIDDGEEELYNVAISNFFITDKELAESLSGSKFKISVDVSQ